MGTVEKIERDGSYTHEAWVASAALELQRVGTLIHSPRIDAVARGAKLLLCQEGCTPDVVRLMQIVAASRERTATGELVTKELRALLRMFPV